MKADGFFTFPETVMTIKILGVVLAVAGWIVVGYLASSWGNQWSLARTGLVAAGLILLGSGASSLLFKPQVK
jgi:hypothetical protein